MDPHSEPHVNGASPPAGEVTLVEIAATLLRNWRLLVILPLAGALLLGTWTLLQDRRYMAAASFIPQAPEGGAPGGAAGLAAQFGLDIGGSSPGQSPQFFAELLRSRAILRQAVESEYDVPGAGTVTLIDYYEVEPPSDWQGAWHEAVQLLSDDLDVSYGRETGVVQFTVTADHPMLAEQVASRLLALLNDVNMQMRQTRATEEAEFVGARAEEMREELLAAEAELEAFLRRNRDFGNSPDLAFQHDRLQRQLAMRQEIYTSLLRSHEQARLDGVRDTPMFTVLENPSGTVQPQRRGTVLRATLGLMLGLALALAIAFAREIGRRGRQAADPRYNELTGLAREAWQDLRRPARWVPGRHRTPS